MQSKNQSRLKKQTLLPLVIITRRFSAQAGQLTFSRPIEYVYNPLDYAQEPHERYLLKYSVGEKKVLFVGMNPGPWGMLQTGIPFGEITAVKDWLAIDGNVGQPAHLHPKRPVDGFRCTRHEPSGKRLWGLMQTRFQTPENFFKEHFVANYCPLAFFNLAGTNVTPNTLPKEDRIPLLTLCNAFLAETIKILKPRFIIGVGQFAETQIQETIEFLKLHQTKDQTHTAPSPLPLDQIIVGKILHPSPANPAANIGWADKATRQLVSLGVWT
jgi:single-strand selective monofunctional uracil DNA glycosylase